MTGIYQFQTCHEHKRIALLQKLQRGIIRCASVRAYVCDVACEGRYVCLCCMLDMNVPGLCNFYYFLFIMFIQLQVYPKLITHIRKKLLLIGNIFIEN